MPWRDERLQQLRTLIAEAVPGVVEEVKWRKPTNPDGVPVWSRNGILCTGETYKDKVKLTFMKGASIEDPDGLFTGGFAGTRRVIDWFEGDPLDPEAFKRLMQRAAEVNG